MVAGETRLWSLFDPLSFVRWQIRSASPCFISRKMVNEVYAEKRGNTLWKRAGRLMIHLNGDVKKEFSNNSAMAELLLQLDFCTMVEYIALHRKWTFFFNSNSSRYQKRQSVPIAETKISNSVVLDRFNKSKENVIIIMDAIWPTYTFSLTKQFWKRHKFIKIIY